VLLVGDGQGYLAALLRQLAGQVDSITPAQLAAGKAAGVYSLVVIDGAIGQIPATLASLVDEGGRIVTGLAERGVTRLAMGRVAGGQVVLTPLADIGMPIVAELAAPKQWQF
jgi:protein-L-isoaspartate(D-aspartate) O-methyltransferase